MRKEEQEEQEEQEGKRRRRRRRRALFDKQTMACHVDFSLKKKIYILASFSYIPLLHMFVRIRTVLYQSN